MNISIDADYTILSNVLSIALLISVQYQLLISSHFFAGLFAALWITKPIKYLSFLLELSSFIFALIFTLEAIDFYLLVLLSICLTSHISLAILSSIYPTTHSLSQSLTSMPWNATSPSFHSQSSSSTLKYPAETLESPPKTTISPNSTLNSNSWYSISHYQEINSDYSIFYSTQ